MTLAAFGIAAACALGGIAQMLLAELGLRSVGRSNHQCRPQVRGQGES